MPVTILEEAGLDADVKYSIRPETVHKFMQELNRLANISTSDTTNRNFANFPTVLQFAFLLSSSSRATPPAGRLMPLPCPKPVDNYSRTQAKTAESALLDINQLDDQIRAFVAMNNCLEETFMSIAVDGMATTADRSYLPGKRVVCQIA
jgi:hypothetical protein